MKLLSDRGRPKRIGVAAAPSVAGLLAEAAGLDLVLLDLRLPDGSTPAENVAALHRAGIGVLVLTSGDEPYLIRQAAQARVLGVVRKSEQEGFLLGAILAAAGGQPVPTLDWATAIDSDADLDVVDLPPQLRKVLELYASGESVAGVAKRTGLKANTVEEYLRRIRIKYAEVGRPGGSKLELNKRAIEDGILPFPRRRRRETR
ncbi:sigma factor-like helix-turn-helix DNA-binding protein [Skermania piniformis]|nr:sigma factor-like helix-turn-helix DNA-binding protein [Skermania piniformis]